MTLFEEFVAFSKAKQEKKKSGIGKKIAKALALTAGGALLAGSIQMGGPQNLLKTPEQWDAYRQLVKTHNQAKSDLKKAEGNDKGGLVDKFNLTTARGAEQLADAAKSVAKNENIFKSMARGY